jgi:hypothetical protein
VFGKGQRFTFGGGRCGLLHGNAGTPLRRTGTLEGPIAPKHGFPEFFDLQHLVFRLVHHRPLKLGSGAEMPLWEAVDREPEAVPG